MHRTTRRMSFLNRLRLWAIEAGKEHRRRDAASPGLVSDCRLMLSFARKNGFVLPPPLLHEIAWLDSVLRALGIATVSQVAPQLIWPIDVEAGPPQYVARDAAAGPAPDLARVIEESVTAHLVADVPVSSFLSGGLDSSIITVLAHRAADVDQDKLEPGCKPDDLVAWSEKHELFTRLPLASLESDRITQEIADTLEAMLAQGETK